MAQPSSPPLAYTRWSAEACPPDGRLCSQGMFGRTVAPVTSAHLFSKKKHSSIGGLLPAFLITASLWYLNSSAARFVHAVPCKTPGYKSIARLA